MTASPLDPQREFEERLVRYRTAICENPPAKRAAVAAILRRASSRHEVLLMTRVEHVRDPWSGHVSLPGGTREPDDADLLNTALRETREEVGLDLTTSGRLLTQLQPITAVAKGGPLAMDITPFVFAIDPRAGRHTDELVVGAEATEAFWFPLDGAAAGDLDGEFQWTDGVVRRTLPCWNYEGRVIWGLTHRMLRDLLAVAVTA